MTFSWISNGCGIAVAKRAREGRHFLQTEDSLVMDDDNERDVITVDIRKLDLPDDVVDQLVEDIEKAVRKAVFNAGSKWSNVVWKDFPGRTRGVIGGFPEGRR